MLIGEDKLLYARQRMVNHQLRARGIRHGAVLGAFLDIPREWFIPADLIHQAYEDQPLPIGLGQTISQPYIVALMLQELDIQPTHTVLDVGAGSGYQTALLSRLARRVCAIERLEELSEQAMAALQHLGARNVTLITGDGSLGWPENAPFDRIICGAAGPEIPSAWIDQLADGGRIVAPIGGAYEQTLVSIDKQGQKISRHDICDVRFVKLIGRAGWPEE